MSHSILRMHQISDLTFCKTILTKKNYIKFPYLKFYAYSKLNGSFTKYRKTILFVD